MRDPTERSPGSWPGDRPIRWRGVASNMTWLVVGSAAAIVQFALVIPVLAIAVAEPSTSASLVPVAVALVWGGLTLYAAWSWVLGRWRVVAIPVVMIVILWLAGSLPSGIPG
jgi:hypothetical protein